MAGILSRTKIANYAADQLQAGNSEVVRDIAAYLVETGRTREAEPIVRTILDRLEQDGIVLADVTSVSGIDETIKSELMRLVGARQLELREHVDPAVLGGIRLETPSRRLDGTYAHRLTQLRERKI